MRKHTVNTILAAVAADYSIDNRRKLAMNQFAMDVARWTEQKLDLTGCAPRHVFEWSTEQKWETLDRLRKKRVLTIRDKIQLKKYIEQMMDWVATHMVLNPNVCWRCAERADRTWQCFPVCEKCYQLVNKPTPVSAAEVKTVQDRIAAVFATAAKPRPTHFEVCSNRKIRHSFVIKVPTGFLMYDGSTKPEMHMADKWTRAEVEIERQVFDDLGTPLSIFRVVKP